MDRPDHCMAPYFRDSQIQVGTFRSVLQPAEKSAHCSIQLWPQLKDQLGSGCCGTSAQFCVKLLFNVRKSPPIAGCCYTFLCDSLGLPNSGHSRAVLLSGTFSKLRGFIRLWTKLSVTRVARLLDAVALCDSIDSAGFSAQLQISSILRASHSIGWGSNSLGRGQICPILDSSSWDRRISGYPINSPDKFQIHHIFTHSKNV